jgi:hypothetical protein
MNNSDVYYRYIDKVITFNLACEDLENYCEAGMKAKVTSISLMRHEEVEQDMVYLVKLDYTNFDDYNRKFETANYYDKLGKPKLTAREAGFYKLEDTLYLGSNNIFPWNNYFEVEHDSISDRMYTRYVNSNTDKTITYLKWLETQLSKYI